MIAVTKRCLYQIYLGNIDRDFPDIEMRFEKPAAIASTRVIQDDGGGIPCALSHRDRPGFIALLFFSNRTAYFDLFRLYL